MPQAYELAADQERIPFRGDRYKAAGGEIVDLTEDIQPNYDFFQKGPGYKALNK